MAQEYTGEVITAQPYSGAVHKPPEDGEPTFFKELGRQIGLTARAGATALAGPINMVTSIPSVLINAGMAGSNALLGTKFKALPTSGELFDRGLTNLGLPEAGNGTERVAQDIASSMGGGATMTKAADAIAKTTTGTVRSVASAMAENPTVTVRGRPVTDMQTMSGAAGGAGIGLTREAGGGPLAQTAVGMATGMLPFAGSAGSEGIRLVARGGEKGRQKFSDTVDTFERGIGITPSVGQAGNLAAGGVETGVSKFPGGNIPILAKAKAEQTALGDKIETMATSVSPASSSKMSVGKQIEEGITGPGGYMDETKALTKQLYDKVDAFMPADHPVPVTNTQRFLDSLTSGRPGAENLLATLQNAKVLGIKMALDADLGGKPGQTVTLLGANGQPLSSVSIGGKPGGTSIPFEAWKDVRSRIGELIGDPQLTSDIPRRQLRALYSSMSKDIEAAAQANDQALVSAGQIRPGQTPTMDSIGRANKVTRLVHDRIDDILQPVMDAGGPERIYNAAVAGTKDGDTVFKGVMRALPQDGKDALVADIFRRMGKATGSAQNAEGNAFSTERFLTQWSNLSPEAKRTLTIGLPSAFKRDLDDVVAIASNLRDGSTVFKNPSGTGQAVVAAGVAGGLLTYPITTATLMGSTYGAARLLSSPTFVHWLAKSTRMPTEAIPAQLNILTQIANDEKHEDVKAAMGQYLESVRR